MTKFSFLFLKDFGSVQIFVNEQGETWLFWSLTKDQQRSLGKPINPFLCFKTADLCNQHLKRPHLTCLTCKLRRVVSGKLPFFYKVSVHQVWVNEEMSRFRKLLTKNLLSITEASS